MATSRILRFSPKLVCSVRSPAFSDATFCRMFSSSGTMWGVHTQYAVKNNIAVIRFDSPDSKVNTLGREVMAEMEENLSRLEKDANVKGAVLISGKPGCFIAGADIGMLQRCKSAQEASSLSKACQEILFRLEGSKKPVVAAIMGSCLGGGLEVAMACHYRVAAKDKKTVVGLPEVLLGLLPGGGGTQRLPQLTSLPTTMDMMLTGKSVAADKAKKLGIVDLTVDLLGPGVKSPEQRTLEYLEEVAVRVADEIASGALKVSRQKSVTDKLLAYALQFNFVKDQIFGKAKAQVMKQTNGLYPAPLRILQVLRTTLDKGSKAGYEAESTGFGELAMTKESRGLIGLFHGQTECKKNRFGKPQRQVKTVGILGAGLMGAGIAQVSVNKGYQIILKDTTEQGLARGQNQVYSGLEKQQKRRKITSAERELYASNLLGTLDYDHFKKCDLVVEAVFESLDLKHKVLREVEAVVPEHCVFASNTSALPIASIAKVSKRPEKVIGMHYFSPVDKMQLLEIIATDKTSQDTKATAVQVGLNQGKVVITVGDGPGFYTTRILAFFLAETIRLLREGVEPKRIDKAMKAFGYPIGSVTLMDEVGIDVGIHINKYLGDIFGERLSTTVDSYFQDVSNLKLFGRKTGKGFYVYKEGVKGSDRPVCEEMMQIVKKFPLPQHGFNTDEDIQLRHAFRMVNEAVLCLQEGILFNPVEGDVGAVFGLGFPPFSGGPFRFVDEYGAERIVAKMRQYETVYGSSFTPCQLLVDHAKDSSKKFHPRP